MLFAGAQAASAAPLSIVNAGFEDTSGQSVFNEFTFGSPVVWASHDPNSIFGGAGFFTGTFQPNGTAVQHDGTGGQSCRRTVQQPGSRYGRIRFSLDTDRHPTGEYALRT
jgi:hypothetical protein